MKSTFYFSINYRCHVNLDNVVHFDIPSYRIGDARSFQTKNTYEISKIGSRVGIYNNAAAYDKSVKGEERSEKGLFSGIDSYIDLQESHEFVINLPEGTYAIALFIDANENLKIDKNFLGIPKEQYGFSNNAMGKLSGPSFEQAKFQVKGNAVQNIKLK